MKFAKKILSLGILTMAMAATSSYAATTLRLSTLEKPGSDGVKAVNTLAERVKERSEGRLIINVYPADQLGDWVEVHDQVAEGAIDMAMQPFASTSDRRFAIGWFPYIFTSYEKVEEATSRGGFVYDIVDNIIADQGMTLLGVYGVGMGGASFTKDVENPADTEIKRNLKVRLWPGGVTHRHMIERMGFNSATMPYSELFTGLQTGVVDGQLGGTAEMTYFSFKDVTKTWLQYNDHFESNWVFINTESLNKIDEQDRKILIEAVEELTADRFAELEVRDNENLDKLREAGINVVTFTDEELENFANVVRKDVWPIIKDEIGDEIYQRLKTELNIED